jgi:hypothetical protein
LIVMTNPVPHALHVQTLRFGRLLPASISVERHSGHEILNGGVPPWSVALGI